MAYKLGDRGPIPHRVGELVGNYNPSLPPGPFNSQKECEQSLPDWSTMRIGRPCPTRTLTTGALEADGWVGVYLTEPQPLPPQAVEVPTPEWMNEPPVGR